MAAHVIKIDMNLLLYVNLIHLFLISLSNGYNLEAI